MRCVGAGRTWVGVKLAVVLVVLAVGLGMAGPPVAAQDEPGCAPVQLGEDSGVYFLALGGNCTADQAEGYIVAAHLVRDDDGAELLVLVDPELADSETQDAAWVLVELVKAVDIDGATWHEFSAP
jgi:hypothetical protein